MQPSLVSLRSRAPWLTHHHKILFTVGALTSLQLLNLNNNRLEELSSGVIQ